MKDKIIRWLKVIILKYSVINKSIKNNGTYSEKFPCALTFLSNLFSGTSLSILKITKQSLSRVLNQLVKEKYIILSVGDDKRTKKLILSKKGQELEKNLSEIQIKKIRKVLLNFNEIDINGFKKILYEMVEDSNKKKFDEINN